jgi:hypothetical protein
MMQPHEHSLRSPYKLAQKRPLTVDGVQQHRYPDHAHPPGSFTPSTNTQHPNRQQRTSRRPFELADGSRRKQHGFWKRFQLPLIISGGMIAGFLVQSLWFGIAAIAVYGVLVAKFHIHSQISFALAFISLLTVPVLLLFKSNVDLAGNFATYTFLLLVIGVIALSFEARPQVRKRKRRTGR